MEASPDEEAPDVWLRRHLAAEQAPQKATEPTTPRGGLRDSAGAHRRV